VALAHARKIPRVVAAAVLFGAGAALAAGVTVAARAVLRDPAERAAPAIAPAPVAAAPVAEPPTRAEPTPGLAVVLADEPPPAPAPAVAAPRRQVNRRAAEVTISTRRLVPTPRPLAGAPAPPGSRAPSEGGERKAAGARLARPGAAPSADRSIAGGSAQTIDSLFGPLPQTESRGRVWIHVNGQLKPVRLRLGITDGTHTEVLSGELQPGMEVVTGVILPAQASSGQTGRSPLMGPTRGPGSGRPPGR